MVTVTEKSDPAGIAINALRKLKKLLDVGKFASVSDLPREIGLGVSFAARLPRLTLLAPGTCPEPACPELAEGSKGPGDPVGRGAQRAYPPKPLRRWVVADEAVAGVLE